MIKKLYVAVRLVIGVAASVFLVMAGLPAPGQASAPIRSVDGVTG
jgi:hypothetical protein